MKKEVAKPAKKRLELKKSTIAKLTISDEHQLKDIRGGNHHPTSYGVIGEGDQCVSRPVK